MQGTGEIGSQRVLVTGCAGFIGSHLSERLIAEGCEVVGVDAFTPFYDREIKEANLASLRPDPNFALHEIDLSKDDLAGLLDGVDVVFHLAGQPGVRQSFGDGAAPYVQNNVEATTRLLAEVARVPERRFVYASSSTIYGDALRFPTPEWTGRQPISPYGHTKVVVEDTVQMVHSRVGLDTVGLRYFSVYGPRQRPDMAFRRFILAALEGRPVPVFGDGLQRRDFTYVGDIVEATIQAAERGHSGRIYNLGGGTPASVREVLELLGELLEAEVELGLEDAAPGDAKRTSADTTLARSDFGFSPRVSLREGLALQVEQLTPGSLEFAEAA
jgi:UDP-glucuronate 4-epimerase